MTKAIHLLPWAIGIPLLLYGVFTLVVTSDVQTRINGAAILGGSLLLLGSAAYSKRSADYEILKLQTAFAGGLISFLAWAGAWLGLLIDNRYIPDDIEILAKPMAVFGITFVLPFVLRWLLEAFQVRFLWSGALRNLETTAETTAAEDPKLKTLAENTAFASAASYSTTAALGVGMWLSTLSEDLLSDVTLVALAATSSTIGGLVYYRFCKSQIAIRKHLKSEYPNAR